ncbi:hypothetical protein [Paenibacillus montanisoli]|uniref:Uncharacterized protein n=1 Tax=Paenibacillus montanisoli TaxID=2081970 RepID=A0A328U6G3_9BACL|nr:hypothetical protein [Paenibacillus montanisoli]RAP76535.1 hypothetical protein DL346_14255 [Paenibacillus montanisoli]
MPSEYELNLVFIHDNDDNERLLSEVQLEMSRVLGSGAKWHAYGRKEDELSIIVVEANGLTPLTTEAEVISRLEGKMESDCWDWLSGYQLTVTPKEDAGSCRLKRKVSI